MREEDLLAIVVTNWRSVELPVRRVSVTGFRVVSEEM